MILVYTIHKAYHASPNKEWIQSKNASNWESVQVCSQHLAKIILEMDLNNSKNYHKAVKISLIVLNNPLRDAFYQRKMETIRNNLQVKGAYSFLILKGFHWRNKKGVDLIEVVIQVAMETYKVQRRLSKKIKN